MADEEINGDTDDIQHDKDKTQKKTAKHDSGVADLEKVTDYAEEKEISSQDISGALSLIGDRRNKEAAERLEKEKELQKVSVKKDDIELIIWSAVTGTVPQKHQHMSETILASLDEVENVDIRNRYTNYVKEMEISRMLAERTLREHRGDVVAALTTLTN